jgi:hypothetical protein
MALETNASQVAGCTVEAVATHDPASFDLITIAVALEVRDDAVVRSDGHPDQAGGSIYLATVLMEIAGEDGLGYLLGEADIEAVDAAATSEVDGPEKLAAGMDFDQALPAPGREELFGQPQGLEDLQGAGVNDGCSIPVRGAGWASIRWQGTPLRWSSAARRRPVGPAPTTRTAVWLTL